jgi:hypothetical protein
MEFLKKRKCTIVILLKVIIKDIRFGFMLINLIDKVGSTKVLGPESQETKEHLGLLMLVLYRPKRTRENKPMLPLGGC